MSDQAQIFVVATPLGNPKDLSIRAQEVFAQADIIACEDTRRMGRLLKEIGVSEKKKLVSYYDAVEATKSKTLVDQIVSENLSLALASDAGTPCVADPGYRLIHEAHLRNVRVSPIAGPSALAAMISVSGLPNHRVLFVGFLPKKKQKLRKEAQTWKDLEASVVGFESAKRIASTLEILLELYPNARICLGRELTKTYEQIKTLDISEAYKMVLETPSFSKGEISFMFFSS